MLTLEEYKLKYPKAFCWGSWSVNSHPGGPQILKEGMLLFSAETAHGWAGPFEGGYAQFVLQDYTNATFQAGKNQGKRMVDVYRQLDLETQEKIDRGYYEYHKSEHPWFCTDQPSIEKPFKLYMVGNDDTSYSKFYATAQEALNDIELFSAMEPLNFWEVVDGFGFIFTN